MSVLQDDPYLFFRSLTCRDASSAPRRDIRDSRHPSGDMPLNASCTTCLFLCKSFKELFLAPPGRACLPESGCKGTHFYRTTKTFHAFFSGFLQKTCKIDEGQWMTDWLYLYYIYARAGATGTDRQERRLDGQTGKRRIDG